MGDGTGGVRIDGVMGCKGNENGKMSGNEGREMVTGVQGGHMEE